MEANDDPSVAGIRSRHGRFKRDPRKPVKGDVFIVDETSMIDLVLGHHLERAIPTHAASILVGDVDQLPSVGPGGGPSLRLGGHEESLSAYPPPEAHETGMVIWGRAKARALNQGAI